MKNILIIAGVIAMVVIGYLLKGDQNQKDHGTAIDASVSSGSFHTVTFATSAQTFTISYSDNADTAVLIYSGTKYELQRARSASGARYTSADGSVVFWEHQGEAMIEIDGERVIEGARDITEERSAVESYKDASYVIDGKSVKLIDGYSETEVTPGSAVKIITRYFGNELFTDLDGDGDDDVAFIVTQETGGSGTFYYAVAALNTENRYVGSDGYLLGDRVAPQSTNVSPNPRHKNVVVFNYADRAPDEPMSTRPSVGKSVYLKIVPETMRWAIVEPDFEGESDL